MNQQIQMDENPTPQDGMNPELEVAEETVAEETTEIPEYEETVPKSQFNQVLARAKKAEAQLKTKVAVPAQINNNQNGLSAEAVEKMVLRTQGLSDELLGELEVIAKARGKSLIDAQSDPLFVLRKEQLETDAKSQKAKLGASRGSGTVKKEKDFNSHELTPEEHKDLWRKQSGR